jgi:hypothetical protein
VQPTYHDNVRLLSADAPSGKFYVEQRAPPVEFSPVLRGKVDGHGITEFPHEISTRASNSPPPVPKVTTRPAKIYTKEVKTQGSSATSADEENVETVVCEDDVAAGAATTHEQHASGEDEDSKSAKDRVVELSTAEDKKTGDQFTQSDNVEQLPSSPCRHLAIHTSEVLSHRGALERTSHHDVIEHDRRENLKSLLSDDEISEDTSEGDTEKRHHARSESFGALHPHLFYIHRTFLVCAPGLTLRHSLVLPQAQRPSQRVMGIQAVLSTMLNPLASVTVTERGLELFTSATKMN